jgi:anti-sigma regulatory factor (Ser/Thr protein kinase)
VAEKPARTIALTIGNDLSEIERVRPSVQSFLDKHGVRSTVRYFVRAAVEELVVNVLRYGFDDDTTHEINVEVRIEETHIVVRVEDDGRPFDPRTIPRPDLQDNVESRSSGGLGIHLIRSTSEEIRYQRRGDRNRVEVRISLTPPETLHK